MDGSHRRYAAETTREPHLSHGARVLTHGFVPTWFVNRCRADFHVALDVASEEAHFCGLNVLQELRRLRCDQHLDRSFTLRKRTKQLNDVTQEVRVEATLRLLDA